MIITPSSHPKSRLILTFVYDRKSTKTIENIVNSRDTTIKPILRDWSPSFVRCMVNLLRRLDEKVLPRL